MDTDVFHKGERAAQARVGVRMGGAAIRDVMPDQHRDFFGMLPFLPAATVDASGAPIATLLTGSPGFITSPDPHTLHLATLPVPGDPADPFLMPGAPVGLLGIDLATRRRNRANGTIAGRDAAGLSVSVRQSFGNCPQYIQGRLVEAAPVSEAAWQELRGLDRGARLAVLAADTFFVATSSGAGTAAGGADISHRGGRPGFIRVDGDVLTVPDFHGNQYFNTLGNLLLDPRAAMLFPDFDTGDLLQLRGTVEIVWDGDEVARFRGAERLWRLTVTGGWRAPAVIPLRWTFRDFSPFSLKTGPWAA
ncbi:MAG: pyridoxamine 5'-phosphate oxidase family protein [Azospirillaceae bacterium]|nr:pyridoxamine 5'-phosphate oxidase family protein [Azospirillaceae bacterium]